MFEPLLRLNVDYRFPEALSLGGPAGCSAARPPAVSAHGNLPEWANAVPGVWSAGPRCRAVCRATKSMAHLARSAARDAGGRTLDYFCDCSTSGARCVDGRARGAV